MILVRIVLVVSQGDAWPGRWSRSFGRDETFMLSQAFFLLSRTSPLGSVSFHRPLDSVPPRCTDSPLTWLAYMRSSFFCFFIFWSFPLNLPPPFVQVRESPFVGQRNVEEFNSIDLRFSVRVFPGGACTLVTVAILFQNVGSPFVSIRSRFFFFLDLRRRLTARHCTFLSTGWLLPPF